MRVTPLAPLPARDPRPALPQKLRADLTAAAFSVSTLTALWGDDAERALHRNQRVPAIRRLDEQTVTPASTLARLFVLGLDVPREQVERALPTLGVDGAAELGLVSAAGDSILPLKDLRPYSFVDADGAGSWWIVSDLGELSRPGPLDEDHVLGVGGASMTLAGLMLQERVDRVLDLGTGCGIQALHAARHAKHVVATDISDAALTTARLNADLNAVTNIEFRHGSLYEPVAGERFDRIVSNPPFVITPRRPGVPAYEYRDGGLVGDEIVRTVIVGCADHLVPGGTVQMLANWEYRAGETGRDRVARWLHDDAADALDSWVIEREVQSPEEYAETWIRDGGAREGTEKFDALYGAWLDDFAERGVRQVGFGYVFLRRRDASSGPVWNRHERLLSAPGQNEAGLGVHIAACVAAHDAQARLSDDDLAASTLVVAGDVTQEQHHWPGSDDPTAIIVRQGGGFGRSIPVDTALAALVGACDGDLSVGAITAALAQLLEVDERALRAQLLPRVREFVDDGILSFALPQKPDRQR
ncbi:methyltransferase family protein [Paramicrobacterium agarici]|nr:methyltransferase family protein [Microbacterium agarici]